MARYRQKDQADLDWNKIRRRLTRELDMQIADFREPVLNDLLAGAWEKYAAALTDGKTLELEEHYGEWVNKALGEAITITAAEVPAKK